MTEQDTELTPVIFRAYREGDVIALFPADVGTTDAYTCGSFMHIGQHGAAAATDTMLHTRPAMPHEYAELKRELESAPYNYRLKVYKRLHPSFTVERKRELGDIVRRAWAGIRK